MFINSSSFYYILDTHQLLTAMHHRLLLILLLIFYFAAGKYKSHRILVFNSSFHILMIMQLHVQHFTIDLFILRSK